MLRNGSFILDHDLFNFIVSHFWIPFSNLDSVLEKCLLKLVLTLVYNQSFTNLIQLGPTQSWTAKKSRKTSQFSVTFLFLCKWCHQSVTMSAEVAISVTMGRKRQTVRLSNGFENQKKFFKQVEREDGKRRIGKFFFANEFLSVIGKESRNERKKGSGSESEI